MIFLSNVIMYPSFINSLIDYVVLTSLLQTSNMNTCAYFIFLNSLTTIDLFCDDFKNMKYEALYFRIETN